jgi:DNA-binding NarL/FixJ family response regulator
VPATTVREATPVAAAVRCLIAVDNRLVAGGAHEVLVEHGYEVVGRAVDVASACAAIEEHEPEVVVCGAGLAGGGALAVLDHLLAEGRAIPVVAIVDPGDALVIPWGFFQGAVCVKDDSTQLLRAVATVCSGGVYVDSLLRARIRARDDDDIVSQLTARELQVLQGVAEGRSTRDIAADIIVSAETVKTHGNVMRKLGVESRSEAVAKAFQLGLVDFGSGPAKYRLAMQGSYPRYGSVPLCTDLADVSASVLRYLYDRVGFALWMVTQTEGDDWIVLQALDRFYGVQPKSVFRWSSSFCSRMVAGRAPRVAPDAMAIAEYAAAPIAQELAIAAYVGVPIERSDGSFFGTLCAIDPERQHPSIEEVLPEVELLARLLGRVL